MKLENRAEKLLKRLVDISSPSTNQSQVRKAHAVLAEELVKLGFQIQWIRDPTGKTDDLLVAERSPSENKTKFITMVSHIDTVMGPEDTGPLREGTDGRLHGAGVIDNKGGLVVMLESLRLFFEKNQASPIGFRVVSSPDEEKGSSAWHKIFHDLGSSSLAVLGFEPAFEDAGAIISSRRGNRWYDLELNGIEAHAGRCSGEELNAAHEAAFIVAELIKIKTEVSEKYPSPNGLGISLNIGHIEGGRERHNIVCGRVTLKIDARFATFEGRDTLHEKILTAFEKTHQKNVHGETVKRSWKIVDDCPPFFSGSDQVSADLISALIKEIQELEPRASGLPARSGGAGDVNHMSRPGLIVLDGLGPVGGSMHTVDEFIKRGSLESRPQALAKWYPQLMSCLLKQ